MKNLFAAMALLAWHAACLASSGSPSCQKSNASRGSGVSPLFSRCEPSWGSGVSPLLFVTNHAGRVLSGTFGGVTNNAFIVSGRAYPLSILPKGEQLRVKKLAGCDVRTAKERRLDHAREMRLKRIRLREQEGEIDKETADRLRRELGPSPRSAE